MLNIKGQYKKDYKMKNANITVQIKLTLTFINIKINAKLILLKIA